MKSASLLRLAVSLGFAVAATAAFAHARFQKATPPVGGTVASASEIRLEFSEGVEPRFSGLTLTDSNGAAAPLGQPKTDPENKSVLIVPIKVSLPPGLYTVRWHAVSVDTHRTQGEFSFTVKP